MVLPGPQMRLLLAARSGSDLLPGRATEPAGGELWVVAEGGQAPVPSGQARVLRLPREACQEPGRLSALIAGRLEPEARGALRLSLHPSLWNTADWGPARLGSDLAALGFRHLAVLLDGTWEQERPRDLLDLLDRAAAFLPRTPGCERRLLAELLAALPVPACLVGSSGRVQSAGPAWEAMARRLGQREVARLLDQARERVPTGARAERPHLLPAGGAWFEFWRGPFLPGWGATLWLAVEATARMGALQAERRARTWLERVIRLLDNTALDPGSRARALAEEVEEWTGLEEVALFRREPRLETLAFLGGVPAAIAPWEGRALPLQGATPVAWVARTGKPVTWLAGQRAASWSTELPEQAGWQRFLCLPLVSQGQTLAVLLAASRRAGPLPGRSCLRELEAACLHTALLLHAGDLFRQAQGAASEWERIFHAVDQPILVVDERFRILRANLAVARLVGVSGASELTGQSAARILYGRSSPPRSCLIRQVLRAGRAASGFRTLPHLGGRFLLGVHPLPGPGGAPVGAVLFARNVSREMELEGRFRGVVENSNALFLVANPWGEIQFAAGVWEALLGYSPGEVQGRNLSEFIHPHDRSRVVETFARLGVKPGKVRDFVYRARHRDGAIRWHQVTGYSEADEGSAPERLYLFVSDVTDLVKGREESEQKRTELRHQRDMLARFLATGTRLHEEPDALKKLEKVCETIRDAGLFRRAVMGLLEPGSRRFRVAAAVGAGREELSLIEEADAVLSLEARSWDPARFQISASYFIPREARLPGEAAESSVHGFAAADRWQPEDLLVVPLRGREGQLIGLLAVDDPPDGCRPTEGTVRALELLARMAVSAVEHATLMEEMARRDREWSAVFGQVQELVAVVDERGRVTRVNQALAEFLGTAAELLVGEEAPLLLRLGELPGADPLTDTLMAGCSSTQQISWKGTPLRATIRPWAELGGPSGVRGAIWMGRLLGEGRAQRGSRLEALGALAGGIVHDFNNMLCAIQGHVSLMIMESEGREEERTLQQVERACLSASKMVARLLDLARERGTGKVLVELCEACRSTLAMLRHTIPAAISFSLELPETRLHVLAEPGVVEELLANLAVNARDAMPGGGELRLSVFGPAPGAGGEPRARIVVEDTGMGIAPEILPRIFDPWFTTKGGKGGSGLGLTSVKRTVEELGGAILVKSEPGKGSRFELVLPVAAEEPSAGEAGPGPEPAPPRGGGETVLVVDDEEPVLTLVCDVLQFLGYRYLAAASGEEAASVLLERRVAVDAVIADYTMPGLGGRDLAERLRAAGLRVPFILSSGYGPELLGGGPEDAFLSKPFKVEDVARALAGVLGARRAAAP